MKNIYHLLYNFLCYIVKLQKNSLMYMQSSDINVKIFMERDLATVLDIKRCHLSANPTSCLKVKMHQKRKWGITKDYKSADEKKSVIHIRIRMYTHIHTSRNY